MFYQKKSSTKLRKTIEIKIFLKNSIPAGVQFVLTIFKLANLIIHVITFDLSCRFTERSS